MHINKYEVYLSSNGVILIEDLLGTPLQGMNLNNIGFKTMIVLLAGCLWQKNKLSLEETGDLFDELISSKQYTMQEISKIVNIELSKYFAKFQTESSNIEDKKK